MPESASSGSENLRYKIRRDAGNLLARLGAVWREKRWFRLLSYTLGVLLIAFTAFWTVLARDLPSAEKLLVYQPPLPTMVRGGDGEIIYSYARERRVQLPFDDFPTPLINAFLSAEDKTFWSHGGVDVTGLAGAVVDYVSKIGTGERARGGSTITQQVAKNILIGDEYSVTRKLREMILARRIEGVLDKKQILELYLNEIPLGRQSFGVQAAARAYFDKDVGDLALHEAAFLAILPKAPERYGRRQHAALAIERRNYVLDQMVGNGWLSAEEAEVAKAKPLGLIPRRGQYYDPASGYFVEEVRRRLLARYGETAEDGPNSVYSGGLWVRTSIDMDMQRATRDALRAGLLRYHQGKGWRGPIAHIDLDPQGWQSQLILLNLSVNYQDWRVGVVLERSGAAGRIGFADGSTATLVKIPDGVRAGNVIAAAQEGGVWAVRIIPEVSGGMVVEEVGTGGVVAMQGGFDSGLGSFNRAVRLCHRARERPHSRFASVGRHVLRLSGCPAW
jgi:penicillin-binding protein 1A